MPLRGCDINFKLHHSTLQNLSRPLNRQLNKGDKVFRAGDAAPGPGTGRK